MTSPGERQGEEIGVVHSQALTPPMTEKLQVKRKERHMVMVQHP